MEDENNDGPTNYFNASDALFRDDLHQHLISYNWHKPVEELPESKRLKSI